MFDPSSMSDAFIDWQIKRINALIGTGNNLDSDKQDLLLLLREQANRLWVSANPAPK